MLLYLIQHGEATSKDQDPDRPLTDAGRENVQAVAARAAGAMKGVARVYHSGKTRARQTAEIVGDAVEALVEQTDNLSPNADPDIWRDRLDEAPEDTALVGHMPHLERLAAKLLCDRRSEVVRFRNGGIVCVGRDDDDWTVRWIVWPEVA